MHKGLARKISRGSEICHMLVEIKVDVIINKNKNTYTWVFIVVNYTFRAISTTM